MSAPALPFAPCDLDRFAKLLGLLGSAYDGERANAAAKADAMLRERGLTWADLIDRLKDATGPAPAAGLWWRDAARECSQSPVGWDDREQSFLGNMAWHRREPSPAQAQWLTDLLDRARAAREAA